MNFYSSFLLYLTNNNKCTIILNSFWGDNMYFNSKEELLLFLKKEYIIELGRGSQGRTYLNKKNGYAFKILEQFFDDDEEFYISYTREEFIKYSGIKNSTYIFGNDNILVNDEVVGYVMRYFNGKLLTDINPLLVNLDNFCCSTDRVYQDNIILANNGIKTWDVSYNIMYGRNKFGIIDTMEYYDSEEDNKTILINNNDNFNYGLMLFLVDGYFDDFISNYKELKDMYLSSGVDIKEFISLYRKYLSEYVGNDIVKLRNASKCLNKKLVNRQYERSYR